MSLKIEKVPVESANLGEAPHWDVETQTLYYVDIYGLTINRYTPSTKKFAKVSAAPKHPTFIIPVAGKKNQFVISLDNEIVIISWDGESDKYSVVEVLATATRPKDIPALAFNDAKCDASGRLWAGTQNIPEDVMKTQAQGTLYSLDAKKQLKAHVDKIKIANGLAFNEKENKFYYIDSLTYSVDVFDFDVTSGTIKNRRVLFTTNKHNISGFPDGMAIDTDGNLWVATFGGNKVLKVDGRKPETLLESIELPALQVTSMAFGGPNLDELYVTTAALENTGLKLPRSEHGVTYKITGTGSKGLPGVNFKI